MEIEADGLNSENEMGRLQGHIFQPVSLYPVATSLDVVK